jgi:ATP-dependent RNA helicase DeaD
MEKENPFRRLGLSEEALAALDRKGFEEPTAIQEKVIPLLLNGTKDIIGQARTGTGKTAAFGLPILERMKPFNKGVQALVLTPTRELAIQVAEELHSLKGTKKLSILPVYGGQAIVHQLQKLRAGVDIVVGTPGRIIDHLERKTLDLSSLSFVVLDEADEMLNMGFIDEVERILQSVGPGRRMLLFSATMPARIRKIAEKYMGEYEQVSLGQAEVGKALTDQIYYEVHEADKFEALCRIADMEENFYSLVFCRTKVTVNELASRLAERGYDAEGLHGDITQTQREQVLGRFRKRGISILVATDVAARGIDIDNLTHVINYSLPQDYESYIHRIGRTGRAGNQGTAITFITPYEYRKLTDIKRMAKAEIRKARVPAIDDVIKVKKDRIVAEVRQLAATGEFEGFKPMAAELLAGWEHEDLLAAVLCYAFRDKLDRKKYRHINEVFVRGAERFIKTFKKGKRGKFPPPDRPTERHGGFRGKPRKWRD